MISATLSLIAVVFVAVIVYNVLRDAAQQIAESRAERQREQSPQIKRMRAALFPPKH